MKYRSAYLLSLMIGIIVLGFFWSLYYVYLVNPMNPYMDSMRFLHKIYSVLTGEQVFLEMLQDKQNINFLYPFITLISWWGWGLNSTISSLIISFFNLCILIVFILAIYKINLKNFNKLFLFVSLIYTVIVFSPAGFEILILEVGLPQTIKNFIFVLTLYQLSNLDINKDNSLKFLFYGFIVAFEILFIANQWVPVFFLSVLVTIYYKDIKSYIAKYLFLILPIFMSFGYYLFNYINHSQKSLVQQSFDFLTFIKAFLFGISSFLINLETSQVFLNPIVIYFLAIIVLFYLAKVFSKQMVFDKFFVSLIVYGMSLLFLVSLVRTAEHGYLVVASSRYYMDYLFVLIGIIGLLVKNIGLKNIKTYLLAFCSLILLSQVLVYFNEFRKAKYRADYFQTMDYRMKFESNNDIEINNLTSVFQAPFFDLKKGLEVMKKYSLGGYRTIGSDFSSVQFDKNFYPKEGNSIWLGSYKGDFIINKSKTVKLEFYLPEIFTESNLITIRVNNKIIMSFILKEGTSHVIEIPLLEEGINLVSIESSLLKNFKKLHINNDERDIAVLITNIKGKQ